MKTTMTTGLWLLCALFSSFAFSSTDDQQVRARALLERAVTYYQQEGERSFAAFSRVGRFTEQDLYVFVVDRSGVMVASGGPSRSLIGRDIAPLLDDHLRSGFESILQAPRQQGVQQSEYRWINWQQGRVERKQAFYQPVNGHIIAVGYYLPRADKETALNMLKRASNALAEDPHRTLAQINGLDSQFYQDDIYPFVVDTETRRFVGHGVTPALLGTRFDTLRDHAGAPLGERLLEYIEGRESGEFSYQWRNPVTQRIETKVTAIQRVGTLLVCVGWYSADD
ncbi:cache domain-containing protein [Halopseudomonas maritima]|uniref:cache domain-containing protein n=1 Tax=Halopseudomonas maritima TaxID=2918528 RepID=UPI001EEA8439|nr:cache domain-containing protein [Halopseudomonas maritima]UJJ31536.1 cache domain-containing protein [Halopseudomonas maritima]